METSCDNQNCFKTHPKNCKFYDKYNRHRENLEISEINILKVKIDTLEEDFNDSTNEELDHKVKICEL